MSKGPVPYDDVYLDEYPSSEDEEDTLHCHTTKPLMSPRNKSRKSRIKLRHPKPRAPIYFKRKQLLVKVTYFCMTLICISLFIFVLMRVFGDAIDNGGLLQGSKGQLDSNHHTESGNVQNNIGVSSDEQILPCSGFDVEPVWIKNFPKLQTESAVRLIDINLDGVLDAVIGFNTVAFGYFGDKYLACSIYFNGTTPCFGGVLALDGRTGDELWRFYAESEIFGLNCEEDINKDGVKDCLGGGRAGEFHLIDGATGKAVWSFNNKEAKVSISNLYTAHYIHDVDGDSIPDILNIHGGDPVRKEGMPVSKIGKLIIFSARTGKVIRYTVAPDGQESYFSPQIYTKKDGTKMVLFGTGGERHGGSLYAVPIMDVVSGNFQKAKIIFHDDIKGVMTPPVFVDLTQDGVVDIVLVPFNGTVVAINGETYQQIWNFTIESSESYSTPAAGFFNDDDVPDFMITYNYGLGYPLYYYSQTTILDGRNGQPIIKPYLKSSGAISSSPITISFEGLGNDAFIYWGLYCKGHEEDTLRFSFKKDESGRGKSKTNFCKQRFGTDDFSKLMVLNQNMTTPGDTIYNSDNYVNLEHRSIINTTVLAMKFLEKYPGVKIAVIQRAMEKLNSHQQAEKTVLPKKSEVTTPESVPQHKHPSREESYNGDDYDEADGGGYKTLMDKLLNILSEQYEDEQSVPVVPKENTPDDDLWRAILEEENRESASHRVPMSKPSSGMYRKYGLNPDNGGRRGETAGVAGNMDDYYFDLPHQRKRYGRTLLSFHTAGKKLRKRRKLKKKFHKKGLFTNSPNTNEVKNKQEITRLKRNSGMDNLYAKTSNYLRKRLKRHAGNHDAEGVQRLLGTGSLAPPLDMEAVLKGDSSDIIFGTYWFYPQETHLILPEQQKCIDSYMEEEAQRMNPGNDFFGMDHDAFINSIEDICMEKESGSGPKFTKENINPLNIYPFNIDAGVLTVYRMRLTCKCDLGQGSNRRCAKVLPYHKQRWPSYMGMHGDSMFGQA